MVYMVKSKEEAMKAMNTVMFPYIMLRLAKHWFSQGFSRAVLTSQKRKQNLPANVSSKWYGCGAASAAVNSQLKPAAATSIAEKHEINQ